MRMMLAWLGFSLGRRVQSHLLPMPVCFDSVFHDFMVKKVETTSCKIELLVLHALNA